MRHALIAVFALVLAGCGLLRSDDPVEPPADLVAIDATLNVERVWNTRLGRSGRQLRLGLQPVAGGGNVYVAGHDGRVTALEGESGQRRWQQETGLPLSAGPGIGGGLVVAGTMNGYVIALDAASGEERWRRFVGGEVLAPPAVSGQVVVVRTVDGRLLGLSPQDGGQRWITEHPVPLLTLRGNAPPVIAGDGVIAAFDNGRLGAYNIADGDAYWELQLSIAAGRSELERMVDINATPVIVENVLYVVGYQGRLAALQLENGQVRWARDFSSYAGLGADNARVYVIDQSSEVLAVSRDTGNSIWLNDRMRMRDLTAPVAVDGALVVGDYDGYLHWLDRDSGEFLARVRAGSSRVLGVLALGDIVVAQLEDGTIAAYRARPRG